MDLVQIPLIKGLLFVGAALGVMYWATKSENSQSGTKRQEQPNASKKIYLPLIEEIKKHINKDHPTSAETLSIYNVILQESRELINNSNKKFRKERRLLITGDLGKYLRFVRDGLESMKKEVQRVKEEILESLEMKEDQFNHAVSIYHQTLEETVNQSQQQQGDLISLEDLKAGINFQRDFIRVNGLELVRRVNLEISYWTPEEQTLVKEILNIFFSDQTSNKLGYEQELTSESGLRYKDQLDLEIRELNDEFQDLLKKVDEGKGQDLRETATTDLRDSKGNFQTIVLNRNSKHSFQAKEERRREFSTL